MTSSNVYQPHVTEFSTHDAHDALLHRWLVRHYRDLVLWYSVPPIFGLLGTPGSKSSMRHLPVLFDDTNGFQYLVRYDASRSSLSYGSRHRSIVEAQSRFDDRVLHGACHHDCSSP